MSMDKRDGRIDTLSPRLRFPRNDTPLRNTLLRLVLRTGMGCARTFLSFDSPLQFRPLQVASPIATELQLLT